MKLSLKSPIFLLLFLLILSSCGKNKTFLPGGDARKNSPDPRERVKKNLEEGKGFRLGDAMKGSRGTTYEFATSNPLWRASLDILDFMPLTSANYSGGLIITDWYSEEQNLNESIKITIRFFSNEVATNSLNIKIFYKECNSTMNCSVQEQDGQLKQELLKEILKKAALYESNTKDKNFRPYTTPKLGKND